MVQVDLWLNELKGIVNYEDSNTVSSDAQTSASGPEAGGFLDNAIRNLESVLHNKSVGPVDNESKPALLTEQNKQFFDVKQILKLNNNPQWKFHQLTKQAMLPEDNQP